MKVLGRSPRRAGARQGAGPNGVRILAPLPEREAPGGALLVSAIEHAREPFDPEDAILDVENLKVLGRSPALAG